MKNFSLKIEQPCQEDFNAMAKNANGAFCQSCVHNVVDFTQKSKSEIEVFMQQNKNSKICGRMTQSQLEAIYHLEEKKNPIYNLKYASAIAASLLLVAPTFGQEKFQEPIEVVASNELIPTEVNLVESSKKITFTIKGKVLDSKTKKPLVAPKDQTFHIFLNDYNAYGTINKKTGEFEISVSMDQNAEELKFTISISDYYYEVSTKFNQNLLKDNVYNIKEVLVDTSENNKTRTMIVGKIAAHPIEQKNK